MTAVSVFDSIATTILSLCAIVAYLRMLFYWVCVPLFMPKRLVSRFWQYFSGAVLLLTFSPPMEFTIFAVLMHYFMFNIITEHFKTFILGAYRSPTKYKRWLLWVLLVCVSNTIYQMSFARIWFNSLLEALVPSAPNNHRPPSLGRDAVKAICNVSFVLLFSLFSHVARHRVFVSDHLLVCIGNSPLVIFTVITPDLRSVAVCRLKKNKITLEKVLKLWDEYNVLTFLPVGLRRLLASKVHRFHARRWLLNAAHRAVDHVLVPRVLEKLKNTRPDLTYDDIAPVRPLVKFDYVTELCALYPWLNGFMLRCLHKHPPAA